MTVLQTHGVVTGLRIASPTAPLRTSVTDDLQTQESLSEFMSQGQSPRGQKRVVSRVRFSGLRASLLLKEHASD